MGFSRLPVLWSPVHDTDVQPTQTPLLYSSLAVWTPLCPLQCCTPPCHSRLSLTMTQLPRTGGCRCRENGGRWVHPDLMQVLCSSGIPEPRRQGSPSSTLVSITSRTCYNTDSLTHPLPRVPDPAGLAWSLRICIFNMCLPWCFWCCWSWDHLGEPLL